MSKRVTRRRFLLGCLGIGAATVATPTCGLLYAFRIETDWLQVERVAVTIPQLSPDLDGFTIAHLSDLHLGPTESAADIRHAVNVTNALNPDLIALTGDFVYRSAEYAEPCAQELAALEASFGVVACLGNHDHWENASLIKQALTDVGISVLVNAGLSLAGGGLWVGGVDDIWAGHPDLDAALDGASTGAAVILLAHEPDYADTVSKHGDVNLQLSGHSHGGQVRLPFIGAPVLPYLGRRYPVGLYRIGKLTLYTNRGVGTIYPPIRFNCRPEVALITLATESRTEVCRQ
jgi:predicted MPP superfamily phosphohydrolase